MELADGWFVCELAYVETIRAIELVTGSPATEFEREWPRFNVVPIDHNLSILASRIAVVHQVRTLDALHLAAAVQLAIDGMKVATWDKRMREACTDLGLQCRPETLAG